MITKKEQIGFWSWWLSIVGLMIIDVKFAAITAFVTSWGIILWLAILIKIEKEKARGNK